MRSFVIRLISQACKLSVLALLVALPAVGLAAETPKKVLIFSGTDPNLPSVVQISQILRTTLEKEGPSRVQFYSEALDNHRIPEEKYEAEMITLLQRKYAGEKLDVIYTLGSFGLKFLLKHPELFPDTTKIFINTSENEIQGLDLGQNVTGVHGQIELKPALDLALSLHPGTRRVVVVTGNSSIDKYWEGLARREFPSYEQKLEFSYVTNVSIEELRQNLASQPLHTIVFFLNFLQDRDGNGYSIPEAVSLVTPSSAPIFVVIQSGFRPGVVGGRMISYEALAQSAANIGVRVLAGEKVSNIPIQVVPSVAMFDWKELQRWNIAEKSLPAGSVVVNREFSVWELYKWHIIGAVTLMVVQALGIAWLLFAQAKRRQAELKSKHFAQLAEVEHQRLDEIVANVPGIVWESRIKDGEQLPTTTFISPYLKQMLGYSQEEWLSVPSFWRTIVVDEDREPTERVHSRVLETGEEGLLQARLRTKDGRLVWIETHVTAIRDENGKSVGMRGVTMDISDRRQAEVALQENQAQLAGIIGSAMDAIISIDSEQRIVLFNAAAEMMFECSAEVARGEPLVSFIPGSNGLAKDNGNAGTVKARPGVGLGIGSFTSLKGRRSNGDEFPIDISISEVELNGEDFYTIIMRDITERLQAEEKLRERQQELSEAQRVAKVGSWEWDPRTDAVNWSEEMFRITQRDSKLGAVIYAKHQTLYTPTSWELLRSAVERGLADGTPYELELEMIRDDGSLLWTNARGEVLRDENGEIIKLRGTLQDITDRKRAESALQAAMEQVSQLKNKLEEENIYLQEEIKLAHHFDEIVGRSDATKYVLFKIEQVAGTDSTVLITGETGTGKELVARAIHSSSLRKERPLVRVNCAALSPTLIESELFGHEKGSFTGATGRKLGRFELADGGTIFLDEIGELPLELQSKLLRVLQESEFERLGSSKTIKVNARVIAATNRNLKLAVEHGTFRQDLWYRLNVFPITVQPLRDRKEDIPGLIQHFVEKFSHRLGKQISSISPASLRKMIEHEWPGNVRELSNVVERAMINTDGTVLKIADQFESLSYETTQGNQTLEEVEKEYITRVLTATHWRIEGSRGAAKILGLNPSTLRSRISKLGIQKDDPNSIASAV
jgi:formate hydrogenlyase transcriptional activator